MRWRLRPLRPAGAFPRGAASASWTLLRGRAERGHEKSEQRKVGVFVECVWCGAWCVLCVCVYVCVCTCVCVCVCVLRRNREQKSSKSSAPLSSFLSAHTHTHTHTDTHTHSHTCEQTHACPSASSAISLSLNLSPRFCFIAHLRPDASITCHVAAAPGHASSSTAVRWLTWTYTHTRAHTLTHSHTHHTRHFNPHTHTHTHTHMHLRLTSIPSPCPTQPLQRAVPTTYGRHCLCSSFPAQERHQRCT